MNERYRHPISFDYPATYQITVQGSIDPSWSDRLEGMTITLPTGDADPKITILVGELGDQSALNGVLNSLYNLRLFVVSIVCLSSSRK